MSLQEIIRIAFEYPSIKISKNYNLHINQPIIFDFQLKIVDISTVQHYNEVS